MMRPAVSCILISGLLFAALGGGDASVWCRVCQDDTSQPCDGGLGTREQCDLACAEITVEYSSDAIGSGEHTERGCLESYLAGNRRSGLGVGGNGGRSGGLGTAVPKGLTRAAADTTSTSVYYGCIFYSYESEEVKSDERMCVCSTDDCNVNCECNSAPAVYAGSTLAALVLAAFVSRVA